jgi:hypothetical protein
MPSILARTPHVYTETPATFMLVNLCCHGQFISVYKSQSPQARSGYSTQIEPHPLSNSEKIAMITPGRSFRHGFGHPRASVPKRWVHVQRRFAAVLAEAGISAHGSCLLDEFIHTTHSGTTARSKCIPNRPVHLPKSKYFQAHPDRSAIFHHLLIDHCTSTGCINPSSLWR